jgi:hypothetical protein
MSLPDVWFVRNDPTGHASRMRLRVDKTDHLKNHNHHRGGSMKLRIALASAALALGVSAGSAFAAAPTSKQHAAMKPSISIKSVTATGNCVNIKVTVNHFRLVKPVYAPPIPKLNGSQGHIHYVLNGKILPTRDAVTSQSHSFCGAAQFVKKGKNVVTVYLATYGHTPFPGAAQQSRTVTVK